MKTTISLLKADIGGLVGHTTMHPENMDAEFMVFDKMKEELMADYGVLAFDDDDLQRIMPHTHSSNLEDLHKMAWRSFSDCAVKVNEIGQYNAGKYLTSDSFSDNIKGMGPGVAEMEFDERPSEPILILMADKTLPGAWNLPHFRMFDDVVCNPVSIHHSTQHDGKYIKINKEVTKILILALLLKEVR